MKNNIICLTLLVSFALTIQAAEKNLIFYSSLDTEQSITHPEVGERGKFNESLGLRPTFGEGVRGGALHVKAGFGNVAFPLPNGLPADCGMVEFDAKIDNNRTYYQDAGDPAFYNIFDAATGKKMMQNFELNANNGMAKSGWYVRMTYLGWYTSLPNFGWHLDHKTVFGVDDPKAWHHYVIRWNVEGLDGSADTLRVLRDGQQILAGQKKVTDLAAYRAHIGQSCWLYFATPFNEPNQNHSDYYIDEFKIWATDKPSAIGKTNTRKRYGSNLKKPQVIKLKESPESLREKRLAAQAAAVAAAKAARIDFVPAWAAGCFVGGGEDSSIIFIVDKSGALAGRWMTAEKVWRMTADYFSAYDKTNEVCVVEAVFESNGKKINKLIEVTPTSAKSEDFEAWACEWEVNPAWKEVAEKLSGKMAEFDNNGTTVHLEIKVAGLVKVTLSKQGVVRTCESTLIPMEGKDNEYRVFIAAPKDDDGFNGFAGEFILNTDDLVD